MRPELIALVSVVATAGCPTNWAKVWGRYLWCSDLYAILLNFGYDEPPQASSTWYLGWAEAINMG